LCLRFFYGTNKFIYCKVKLTRIFYANRRTAAIDWNTTNAGWNAVTITRVTIKSTLPTAAISSAATYLYITCGSVTVRAITTALFHNNKPLSLFNLEILKKYFLIYYMKQAYQCVFLY
jgi:hypothetical protein